MRSVVFSLCLQVKMKLNQARIRLVLLVIETRHIHQPYTYACVCIHACVCVWVSTCLAVASKLIYAVS